MRAGNSSRIAAVLAVAMVWALIYSMLGQLIYWFFISGFPSTPRSFFISSAITWSSFTAIIVFLRVLPVRGTKEWNMREGETSIEWARRVVRGGR